MRVLICGGGVVGASIAYFLARRGARPVVVERAELACAASGKSGGFLALDWCDGTALRALARRSFALHAELADSLGADIGYRRLDTYGGHGGADFKLPAGVNRSQAGWVSERVHVGRRLGSPRTTAQVHPEALTRALMAEARRMGGELRHGTATGLVRREDEARVVGVEVDGAAVEADAVVVAMGPWSILASAWLPLPGVWGVKGHSVVLAPEVPPPAEALFLEYAETGGATHAPEVFPRPDGTVWACAISSDAALPVDPATVAPDPGVTRRLEALCRDLSPALATARVVARQACFRPVTRDGLPLMGRIAALDGAYVATGHGVWGILNAPASGEAMAELILDGAARTVDLAAFDPGRLPPFDAARLS